jgi:peptidoglycan/LPS O-acetylase OafA/YrhL
MDKLIEQMNVKKYLEKRIRGWLPKEPHLPSFRRATDQQKRREWLGALILVSVIIVFVAWSLLLNPQYGPLFLAVAIGALVFVAVMSLLPKLRRRFIERVVANHVRDEERGRWLYRYRKVAIAVIAVMALIFPIAMSLLPSQYIAYFAVAIVIVNLVAGTVLIAGLASSTAKKIVLFVFLLFLMGIIASLLLRTLSINFLQG